MVSSLINGPERKSKAKATLRILGKAFDSDCGQDFRMSCNLSRIVPALAKRGYKEGSPFVKNFILGESPETIEVDLNLEITNSGTSSYRSFSRPVPRFYTLKDIDSVPCGRKMRQDLERLMEDIAAPESMKNGKKSCNCFWSISLFGSSHNSEGSVLIFKLKCREYFSPSYNGDDGMLVVACTSEKLDKDAREVVRFMIKKGYNNIRLMKC
jgi:hypothetical protein